jgi:RNase P protein component
MLTAFLLTEADNRNVMIGFSVPKRQVPLAAHRIRIRRLMREAVRRHVAGIVQEAELHKTGVRIVLMFKRDQSRNLLRLTLGDIEPAWIDIQQRIVNAL